MSRKQHERINKERSFHRGKEGGTKEFQKRILNLKKRTKAGDSKIFRPGTGGGG